VELVAVDGLSLTDAAAALNIRPTTARVRWLRARRFLYEFARPPARDEVVATIPVTVETGS
jgi:RNA polymerase sigma-70 factor (ECF subfamily)